MRDDLLTLMSQIGAPVNFGGEGTNMAEALLGAELIDAVSTRTGIEPETIGLFLDTMGDLIFQAFDDGAVVEIPGLGVYAQSEQSLDEYEQGVISAYDTEQKAKKTAAKKTTAKKTASKAKPTTRAAKKAPAKKVGSKPPASKGGAEDDPLGTPDTPTKRAGRRKRTA